MYRVIIINNNVETIIHEPGASKTLPHILSSNFKEVLSMAEQFTFTVPYGNPGYDLIEGLITKVKLIDTRDNSVIFTGRVLNTKDGMEEDGTATINVICEGALNYFNDSQTRRWHFQDQTPEQILTYLLNEHNSKVDTDRQIQVGTIEITQHITIDTNYETTLNTIITKLHNILGGDFKVRESSGVLYLDYLLAQGENNEVILQIGVNAKQIIREYDPIDIITRAIPQGYGEGINQLDITSVNSGVEYIEDATAKAKYGVIEGLVSNKDIQNANTLMIYGQTVLDEKKQPKLTLDTSAVDRSVLSKYSMEKYEVGDTLHILASFMNIDVYARVIERERDLINSPWEPTLTISTRPITLSDQIIDLKQRNLTLENAPQGNTFLNSIPFTDNMDAAHSVKIPIWISPDVLYINRVRLFVESQKFRAYSKSATAQQIVSTSGPSSKTTSDSGGQSTQTSSSGGASTQTSSSGGGATVTSSGGGGHTHLIGMNTGSDTKPSSYRDFLCSASQNQDTTWFKFLVNDDYANANLYTYATTDHTHSVSVPNHAHTVNTPAHTHDVNTPNHSHGMDHTHQMTIPQQELTLNYGIYEDTFPSNVQIKINDTVIPNVSLSEGGTLEMDISQYIGQSGQTYTLEIISNQRGRVAGIVDIQAFIQTK